MKVFFEKNIDKLSGEWVSKNSNYEKPLCKSLGIECDTSRYWDAILGDDKIEIKKGKSIWLDLVRYSETLLEISEQAKEKTKTIFFVPDKERTKIVEIIIVETSKIVEKLKLTKEKSKIILKLKEENPRSLNVQASLTLKDVRELPNSIIVKS